MDSKVSSEFATVKIGFAHSLDYEVGAKSNKSEGKQTPDNFPEAEPDNVQTL